MNCVARARLLGPRGKYPRTQRARWTATSSKPATPKWRWRPIPLWMGLGVLGWVEYRHIRARASRNETHEDAQHSGARIEGPWQVQLAAALPLRALSRLWGQFNELELPVVLRNPLYRLYATIFGCNLDEMAEPDLRRYPNMASFFYRALAPGSRPVDEASLVAPSDGRVVALGAITDRQIEHVKGASYSLDALLEGSRRALAAMQSPASDEPDTGAKTRSECEFADINHVPYSLEHMLGDDATAETAAAARQTHAHGGHVLRPGNALHYIVLYLAPGDYHRFHSPADWRIERRRHVSGELFSVSPHMLRLLSSLFVVNERVVLLGEWMHGFFSMIPVGATNVGSIRINIDPELRTNLAHRDLEPAGHVSELAYTRGDGLTGPGAPSQSATVAARIGPRGFASVKGEELGGFMLGSTVVLVFEAPADFEFSVREGDRVQCGQRL